MLDLALLFASAALPARRYPMYAPVGFCTNRTIVPEIRKFTDNHVKSCYIGCYGIAHNFVGFPQR